MRTQAAALSGRIESSRPGVAIRTAPFFRLFDRGEGVAVRSQVGSFGFSKACFENSPRSSSIRTDGAYGRRTFLHLEIWRGHGAVSLLRVLHIAGEQRRRGAPVESQYQTGFRRMGRQMGPPQMLRWRPLPASSSPLSIELVPVLLGRPSERLEDHCVDSTESPSPSEEDPLPMVGHSA